MAEGDYEFVCEHQEMVRSILDSIHDGVFTVDSEWRITCFNRAAERITGWSRMEALGRPCHEVLGADLCREDRCALKETLRSGQPVRDRELILISRRGERIPISLSTSILRDSDGSFVGGVETFRDLRVCYQALSGHKVSGAFYGIISNSPKVHRLFEILEDVAASEAPVLIQGESGTGKELFANVIHRLSPRKTGPLIKVNCGALPETLLESELFGYVKGAFTDARQDKPGRFQLAHGGTLFLDEIGEMPLPLQVKILRVLQNGEFEPLGSTQTLRTDVRIVAATHRDLKRLMKEGLFREDLYYRIHVVRLEIPPLRERPEDIPPLIQHIIGRLNEKTGKSVQGLTEDALRILMEHDFPGNVRELENILEHAFILCRDASLLSIAHLPAYLTEKKRYKPREISLAPGGSLEDLEIQIILETLRKHKWHRGRAAKELGIGRSTLWRKLKRYGIQP